MNKIDRLIDRIERLAHSENIKDSAIKSVLRDPKYFRDILANKCGLDPTEKEYWKPVIGAGRTPDLATRIYSRLTADKGTWNYTEELQKTLLTIYSNEASLIADSINSLLHGDDDSVGEQIPIPAKRNCKRGKPKDPDIKRRVKILHKAGIKIPADLRDIKKIRNAFGALDQAKCAIPGYTDCDWMGLLDDSERSEEFKKVKESLRLNLIRA
jgi:hypothetical protein